jgi:hypothetical protein
MPVIGFLSARSAKDSVVNVAAFGKGLEGAGFVEGKNLSTEYRFAEARLDRLPELAADLVRRQVAVLVAVGGANAALVAKKATSTIPIVFVIGGDPVELGLSSSLSRPDGNATGMTIVSADLAQKRLGLLRELAPNATAPAALINSNAPEGRAQAPTCVRRRSHWVSTFVFWKRATRGLSKARSRRSRKIRQTRWWSEAIRFSACIATDWSRSSRRRRSRRSTSFAIFRRPAA